jgi:hypothetical protein
VWRLPLLLLLTGGYACSGAFLSEPCGLIPEGGCPTSRGGSCADATCARLFRCIKGEWEWVEACPENSGVSSSTVASSSSGGSCPDKVDVAQQSQGCTPELQLPDCAAEAANQCEPCLTGCVDFFFCSQDGWQTVAYCTDEGELIVEP